MQCGDFSILALLSLLEISQERDVPFLWWNGSVAYYSTTSFGENDDEDEEDDYGEDDEEPEDGAPA